VRPDLDLYCSSSSSCKDSTLYLGNGWALFGGRYEKDSSTAAINAGQRSHIICPSTHPCDITFSNTYTGDGATIECDAVQPCKVSITGIKACRGTSDARFVIKLGKSFSHKIVVPRICKVSNTRR
jgi:hypothetical protein